MPRPSPCPAPSTTKQSTLLLLPRDLALPNESSYQQSVAQAIIDAAVVAGGRTMVLFTSYSQLRTTATAIRAPLDQMDISLLQHGASSRGRLLREFRQSERTVLLGTRTFWEGIDLPGDQLSVLIIAKLPFAVPSDPLVAARSREFENPFYDYTIPDAILRFRQGFGRLIRRTSDRGVVILLDSRALAEELRSFISGGAAHLHRLPCTAVQFGDRGRSVAQWIMANIGRIMTTADSTATDLVGWEFFAIGLAKTREHPCLSVASASARILKQASIEVTQSRHCRRAIGPIDNRPLTLRRCPWSRLSGAGWPIPCCCWRSRWSPSCWCWPR